MLISWVRHTNPSYLFTAVWVTLQITVMLISNKQQHISTILVGFLCVWWEQIWTNTSLQRSGNGGYFPERYERFSLLFCSELSSIIYTLLSPHLSPLPLLPSPLVYLSILSLEKTGTRQGNTVYRASTTRTPACFSMMLGTFHWLLLFSEWAKGTFYPILLNLTFRQSIFKLLFIICVY